MRIEIEKSNAGWWVDFKAGRYNYNTGSRYLLQALYWLIRGLWRTRKPRASTQEGK